MKSAIPNPIRLGFDPKQAEEAIQTIFADDIARTLWLSWRVGHITSQHFTFDCMESAKRLKACPSPITEADLLRCLGGYSFPTSDVRRWATDAVKFFNDEELRYTIPGEAP